MAAAEQCTWLLLSTDVQAREHWEQDDLIIAIDELPMLDEASGIAADWV